jgi:uncharacterized protein YcfL
MRRWFSVFILVALAGGCCAHQEMIRAATIQISQQAEVAKTALPTCGVEGEQRQAACDRVSKSLDDILQTSNTLQEQAK